MKMSLGKKKAQAKNKDTSGAAIDKGDNQALISGGSSQSDVE